MMYLALTYDHRLLDGREAVTFLVKVGFLPLLIECIANHDIVIQVKQYIEDPQRMLLG